MRYNVGHAEVLAEGFTEEADFGIANSTKAFKSLIDGVYSRKAEAITRELATNAFDAHKAAGSIAPFEIHLPTPLAPVFWIRDFGTGMSHHQIMTRYRMLFDSTKDGTNEEDASINPDDQVGCLGLGSKAFFAYTDACTLTVWQDGEMRVYSVFMGPKGRPKVTLMGQLPSDEPVGVKVEFPVKAKDFSEFKAAAIRVFKGFPIQPVGLPDDAQKAIAVEPVRIGKGWKAYPKDYLPGGGFYARQGCVLYPIELAQIDARSVEDEEGKVHLSHNFARFEKTDLTVVIDFKIGSLGFDLSRERLAYDDATVLSLRGRWDAFTSDVEATFTSLFDKVSAPFERMKLAHSDAVRAFGPLLSLSAYGAEATDLADRLLEDFPKPSGVRGYPFELAIKRPQHLNDYVKAYRNRTNHDAPKKAHAFHNAVILYVDRKHPKNRTRLAPYDIKKVVGAYLWESKTQWAFVVGKGKLTLARWRRWGRPKIVRLSDLQSEAAPKKVRERTAGVFYGFDRFKIPAPVSEGYLPSPADFEVKRNHRFALINCGLPVLEEGKPFLPMNALLLFGKLMALYSPQRLILINTRKNEAPSKWDSFKRFHPILDTFVAKLPPAAVREIVNALNYYRFSGSRYDTIRREWVRWNPHSHDPIARLGRFEKRFKRISDRKREIYLELVSVPGTELLVDQIIERGRAMNLEILPVLAPHEADDEGIKRACLMPARWEKIVNTLRQLNNNGNRLQPSFLKHYHQLLLKDALSKC